MALPPPSPPPPPPTTYTHTYTLPPNVWYLWSGGNKVHGREARPFYPCATHTTYSTWSWCL
jgi:hypothetical protein